MQTRRILRSLWLVASLVAVFVLVSARPSDARMPYKKGFDILYKENLPKTGAVTCAVCHPGETKRELNRYGKALAEELGEKDVRDMERILAALKAIGKPKSNSDEWPSNPKR
ncbi:MAG: hypothetical protein IAG10_03510 [Planctomycetaceae bacterium]|nr:hypothetical protein [Planctomycetaceae bacterium]